MGNQIKIREDRLRRVAARQGLVLRKSPRRDVRALDYGKFHLTRDGIVVFGGGQNGQAFAADIEQVEEYLNRPIKESS